MFRFCLESRQSCWPELRGEEEEKAEKAEKEKAEDAKADAKNKTPMTPGPGARQKRRETDRKNPQKQNVPCSMNAF